MSQEVFEGQCQCGSIQYRISGVSLTMFACHCTECQRQAGSAFGMALWIKQPLVEVNGGPIKEWIRQMPSGKQMSCQFCPDCGTRLFHKVLGQDQILSIKPGTLNHPRDFAPVGHLWLGSKQKWVSVDHSSIQYPGNPETFDDLIGAWECAGFDDAADARSQQTTVGESQTSCQTPLCKSRQHVGQ